jgi:hypothetical protein
MTLGTPAIHKKRTAEEEDSRSVKARSPRNLFLTPKNYQMDTVAIASFAGSIWLIFNLR